MHVLVINAIDRKVVIEIFAFGNQSGVKQTATNVSCTMKACGKKLGIVIKNEDRSVKAPYPSELKVKVRALNKVGWGQWTYPSYPFIPKYDDPRQEMLMHNLL